MSTRITFHSTGHAAQREDLCAPSLPFCAYCLHRHGDLCTHPGSPVNQPRRHSLLTWLQAYLALLTLREPRHTHCLPGECGPVCYGEEERQVRPVKP